MLITEKIFLNPLDPTQGLNDTTLTEEKEYFIFFTEQHKKSCLILHYNVVNNYIFVNSLKKNLKKMILK